MKNIYIESAKKTRTCRDCGKSILSGEKCLVVMEDGYRFKTKVNRCMKCASNVIADKKEELEEIWKLIQEN